MRPTREEREDLARRKEQWILRTEQGEDPERVRRELKVPLQTRSLGWLKRRYQAGGRQWQALLQRRHGVASKGTPAVKAFLARAKERKPQLTAAELCGQVWERFEIDISLGHMTTLVRQAGLSNPPGRPAKTPTEKDSATPGRDIENAGAFFPSGRTHRTGRARGRAKRG